MHNTKSHRNIALKSVLLLAFCTLSFHGHSQVKLTQDTLECFNIGFGVGTTAPWGALSHATSPDGTQSQLGTMSDLYEDQWIDFTINCIYKFKSNWLITLDGDMWFGNDNLTQYKERMSDIFTQEGTLIGFNGTDPAVTNYNRALALRVGFGKIFKVIPDNPNSGILAKMNVGFMEQQTIFTPGIRGVGAPMLTGDYAYLYDHQRNGLILTEGIGWWFMSNRENLINFYIAFEVSQCFTSSTRDYIIDNVMGLRGPDNAKYFDMLYSIKFCWMFPLKGKTTFDYYFY